MFSVNSYAKIKEVEDKGNYSVCKISISKKNKQSGKYETDFVARCVSWATLIINAHWQTKEYKLLRVGFLIATLKTTSWNFQKHPFTRFLSIVCKMITVQVQASQ